VLRSIVAWCVYMGEMVVIEVLLVGIVFGIAIAGIICALRGEK
jgi:hypothetical protein